MAHEGSFSRRPRFVCKEGAALDRAYGRPVQAAWLFSAAQIGGRYLRPQRPQGPRHSISRDCRGRSPVGPSSASVYRPPPGNWQSRWSTRDYLLRGQCGRCGRSCPDVFWRTSDTEKAVPALASISAVFDELLHLQKICNSTYRREGHFHGKRTASRAVSNLSKCNSWQARPRISDRSSASLRLPSRTAPGTGTRPPLAWPALA